MSWQLTPCEIFPGSISEQGYGRIYVGGRRRRAHVVKWESINGAVPTGFQLDHLCRNRACRNMMHLELVTSRENTLRGIGPTALNARKTKCPLGHDLAGNNLIVDRLGKRSCKTCQRDSQRKYKQRRRGMRNAAIALARTPDTGLIEGWAEERYLETGKRPGEA